MDCDLRSVSPIQALSGLRRPRKTVFKEAPSAAASPHCDHGAVRKVRFLLDDTVIGTWRKNDACPWCFAGSMADCDPFLPRTQRRQWLRLWAMEQRCGLCGMARISAGKENTEYLLSLRCGLGGRRE